MFITTFNLVIESIQTIAMGGNDDLAVPLTTLSIIATTVTVKTILFVLCYTYKDESTSASALATDHRNDVISNTFGLAFAIMGQEYFWAMDPIGALCIAAYLMRNWWNTGMEQVEILSGKAADQKFLSRVTFLCWNHHPKIQQIDTVKAYFFSDGFLVQIDIVVEPNMTVRESHDIAESLQMKVEELPEVDKCFVHIDYETSHKPEH
jgi:divalent metal cation (Fe/Co/Zn/Cd) transporter